ncbi:MAG: cytochrome-c peroxidase, partial [Bacteroidia bacterium]|nr:cytochrome-c peroxidase [Bacteroidia bacterium]
NCEGFYCFHINTAYDFSKNQLTKEKILLGRVLFYDPILSKNNTISCASCHSQYTAFTHVDHALSHGIADRIGNRNAPALMNLAWHQNFMWDGAIHHLDFQSLAPIENHDEMDEKIENVVLKLNQQAAYKQLFLKAYGDSLATGERTLKALSQFMLTLVSANSKYDKVMAQKDTFTQQEQNGYLLFKQHCESCHTEPLFTNLQFENNGLPFDTILKDWGRMRITQKSSDSLKFKVPTLRNIEFSFPYMHDGRFKKLSQVLNHYTNGMVPYQNLSPALKQPIILTSNQKVDITAFLLTLTDKEFLFNKQYSYPR